MTCQNGPQDQLFTEQEQSMALGRLDEQSPQVVSIQKTAKETEELTAQHQHRANKKQKHTRFSDFGDVDDHRGHGGRASDHDGLRV